MANPKQARQGGWQQAIQLYAALAAGQRPSMVYAPDFLPTGAVFMDVPFNYSRFYAVDSTYEPGSMFAIGSPGFVAAVSIGRLICTSIGYARAASLSRRTWRDHRPARVVVTTTGTWCQVDGRWLYFDHNAVTDYRIGDQCCVLTFSDTSPLRLYGPSAWCHAVLYAYLRYGPAWQAAPFLYPVRRAAQQLISAYH
jgi:hypothetical protein